MEKLFIFSERRILTGLILIVAGAFALAGAWLFESTGLASESLSPVTFVSSVFALKFGLFAFWPLLTSKGREAGSALKVALDHQIKVVAEMTGRRSLKKKAPMVLWDENDPRVDLSLFSGNIPTFVLNQDQRFLDWNPAFELVFGRLPGMRRGAHVSEWFGHLDNFRRVPVRTQKLYGEGILPISDRERVTFISPKFGRMVFTKIMTPIINRGTGRISGWNVVLNMNSVNRRTEFLEALFAVIAHETRRVRYASSFDLVFERYPLMRSLIAAHTAAAAGAVRVMDLGCRTGMLTEALLESGCRVTAVDLDVHQLRQTRDKTQIFEKGACKIIRKDPEQLGRVPEGRYDAVASMLNLHQYHEPLEMIRGVFRSLKPGGQFAVSFLADPAGIEGFYNGVRVWLEQSGRTDVLQYSFNHVLEYEQIMGKAIPYRYHSREDIRAWLVECGFSIVGENSGFADGSIQLIKAVKPA